MTVEAEPPAMSEAEARAFAAKLAAWTQALSPPEQALVRQILATAAAAPADAQGFAMSTLRKDPENQATEVGGTSVTVGRGPPGYFFQDLGLWVGPSVFIPITVLQ